VEYLGKTHAEKIREAVTDLGVASPNEIMQWIKKHYPNENANPRSYRADIIGCSINHSSSRHYPGMPQFLWFEKDTKRYRLAKPEEAAKMEPAGRRTQLPVENSEFFLEGVPLSRMSVTGQVEIPASVREKLGLKPGDLLAFIVDQDALKIRKAKIKVEFE